MQLNFSPVKVLSKMNLSPKSRGKEAGNGLVWTWYPRKQSERKTGLFFDSHTPGHDTECTSTSSTMRIDFGDIFTFPNCGAALTFAVCKFSCSAAAHFANRHF